MPPGDTSDLNTTFLLFFLAIIYSVVFFLSCIRLLPVLLDGCCKKRLPGRDETALIDVSQSSKALPDSPAQSNSSARVMVSDSKDDNSLSVPFNQAPTEAKRSTAHDFREIIETRKQKYHREFRVFYWLDLF